MRLCGVGAVGLSIGLVMIVDVEMTLFWILLFYIFLAGVVVGVVVKNNEMVRLYEWVSEENDKYIDGWNQGQRECPSYHGY